MDSGLLLKYVGYFPDYLSALSRFLSLSKQLYKNLVTFKS